ncbi:MAG: hypothetical protein JEY97_08230 [Bacteroidales bacterium]|nr:hypothetical protein [Bacteroidales bacterium]
MENIINYINHKFGVSIKTFQEALKLNPGAEGYILGSIGELLFKDYIESIGYEALRIKEKPDGGYNAKSTEARGDFYIRKKGSEQDKWYVVECKGVKSNSEKRSGLIKQSSCINILTKHSVNREKHITSILKSGKNAYSKSKEKWEKKNKGRFPKFKWSKINPGAGIPDLTDLWNSKKDIEEWLKSFSRNSFSEDAYWNLIAPIRLLQTHMPSTRIDPVTKLKSTGPLVTEFNILCVDLFLKTGKHEFVYANANDLNPQAKSPNHLQQNYTIDILTKKDNYKRHPLLKPWYDSIDECIKVTKPKPRNLDESQLDKRKI